MKPDNVETQDEMLHALDHEDGEKRPRTHSFFLKSGPNLKHLVLRALPGATVRRTVQGDYACFIDGKPMNWHSDHGAHGTSTQAWACIGRFVMSAEFVAGAV